MPTQYGTYAGLKSGPDGDIFATGGFVCPSDLVGYTAGHGARCQISGPVDAFVRDTVLPHLAIDESAVMVSEGVLRAFGSWFESAYGSHLGTYWVVDDLDPAFEVDPLVLAQERVDLRLHPLVQIHSLRDLLVEAGIGPDQRQTFRQRTLGRDAVCNGKNYYHPNNIGERTVRLARAALSIVAARG